MCEAKLTSAKGIRHTNNDPPPVVLPNPPQRRKPDKSEKYMGFWWTSCLTVLGTAIIVAWIPNLLSPGPPKGNVDGFVVPQLKKVEETFRLHLLSEEEKGAAFSVFKDGKLVVDLWGGYADIEAWQPWKRSTVANTYSLFNAAISLCLGLLYERQLIDYDKTVSYYWPEFSSFDKQHVTVRDLLSEQAGLLRLNKSLSLYNISDNLYLSAELARQRLSDPGQFFSGYLKIDADQGMLELYADQLVRRTDPQQRSLKLFFEEEFARKCDLEFYVGLPLTEQHRAARVRGHGFSVVFEILFAPIELISTIFSYIKSTTFTEINSVKRLNDPMIRSSSVGYVSGFASATALAQLYNNAILSGPDDKPAIISGETWDKMSRPVSTIPHTNLAVQLGLISNWTISAAGQIRSSPKGSLLVGYSGFGGQYTYVDRERNISLSYLTNYNSIYRSALDPRFKSLLRALYESIK